SFSGNNICKKECSSFCNSHSIPRFCLANISIKGRLYYSANLIDLPMLPHEKGIGEAGTFHLICHDCDNTLFDQYENPSNYSRIPTDKMLSQIALKNYLKSISKREYELSLYNNISQMSGYDFDAQQTINKLDLNEYIDGFRYAKKATQSKWDNHYHLCYFDILNYVVPLSFQGNMTLIVDFEGKMINNIYHPSSDYKLKDVHLCVFPLENQSVVIMFEENGEKRNRAFYKQFRNLSTEEKLKALNFIIFSYSEDVYLYKGIDESVLKNEELRKVAQQTTMAELQNPFADPLKAAMAVYDLNKRHTIPNLLDVKYRTR
ncbi:hypothetical protein, partial [Paenibacillus ferrarius]|uniref:hypothetical protein n=1 Tax=Paenibacillus ferrarius TaxID=1469647 RepID=UPI003D2AE7DF